MLCYIYHGIKIRHYKLGSVHLLGVGSFVFADGLVSSEARRGTSEIKQNRLKYLRKTLSSALPLLILGFLRFASVKASGYHEHVSEYGLHWNFFFTLAFTKMTSSLVFVTSFPIKWSWIVAIVLAACHETSLGLGLSEWILENAAADRNHHDLISANREGLVSGNIIDFLLLCLINLLLYLELSVSLNHEGFKMILLSFISGRLPVFTYCWSCLGKRNIFKSKNACETL